MNVLVTGATGAIGPRVVQALAAAGHRVRRLARQPDAPGSPASSWPPAAAAIDTIRGDLLDPAAIAEAVRGMDAVVHLAALLHRTGPDAAHEAEYRRVNDEGTRMLVEAARTAGARRFVLASTIAVYGGTARDGVPVTEAQRPAPDTAYARTKLAAERHVLEARTAAGEPMGVVFRLGAVYGAGIKGNYRELVIALARGRFVPLGPGDNRRSLIHDEDVARAMILGLAHPLAPERVFNLTDGQLHRVRDIVSAICAALGRRPPLARVPVPIALVGAAAIERLAAIAGRRPPVTRAMIVKYLEEAAVDGTRARRELGFVPRMTLAEGWAEVVSGLRRDGVIPDAGR